MKDVMIDFETLGNGPDSCIIQVGAVYFDKLTGELGESFQVNIDAQSSVKAGGAMDASTVEWWLQQSEEARKSILAQPREDIVVVMQKLNEFLSKADRIWSHATFDFVLLTNTLKKLGIKPSFSYKAGMDLRTLVYVANTSVSDFPREGTHHNGLDDAKHQVKYATAALNAVKGNKAVIKLLSKLSN